MEMILIYILVHQCLISFSHNLTVGAKESDGIYSQFQKEIDKFRGLVYKNHEPVRKVCMIFAVITFLSFPV